MQELKLNGYPEKFIFQTSSSLYSIHERHLSCIPYMKGISEQVKQLLKSAGVRTIYKPMPSLGDIFGKPKDKQKITEVKGIVYKFECPDCSFTYVGESKRSWKSLWAEHKPGVRPEIKSAIKDHTESTGHNASINNATILEKRVHNLEKTNIPPVDAFNIRQ